MVYPEAVRKQGFARILCIWSSAARAFPYSPKSNHPVFNPLAQEGGLRFGIPVRLREGGGHSAPRFLLTPRRIICSELSQERRVRGPMGTMNATAGGTFCCQAGGRGAKVPFQPGVSFPSHSVVSISNNNS